MGWLELDNLGRFLRKINHRKNGRSLLAVSEVIGHVLMLLVAVSSNALIYDSLLDVEFFEEETHVDLNAYIKDSNSIILHSGGEPITLTSEIQINVAGKNYDGPLSNWVKDENQNGYWNCGEKLIFPIEYDLSTMDDFSRISMNVIDNPTNSLIFTGGIALNPESDAGVTVSISNTNPTIGEEITITITVTSYGGDVNGSSDINILCPLPKELEYIASTSSPNHGSYNNKTGVWNVGTVFVECPATLEINAKISEIGTGSFTQFVLINDVSNHTSKNTWNQIKEGFKKAINDETAFPHNGVIELSFLKYGFQETPHAQAELTSTVITQDNYDVISSALRNSKYIGGNSPMSCGIRLATDILYKSENYHPNVRQIILLVTTAEGNPDCEWITGTYNATQKNTTIGKLSAENAIKYLKSTLNLQENQDEINVIVINDEKDEPIEHVENIPWLNQSIAWPHPQIWNYSESYKTPSNPGWITYINEQNPSEFEERINLIFKNLLSGVEINVQIIGSSTTDPSPDNDQSITLIKPQIIG